MSKSLSVLPTPQTESYVNKEGWLVERAVYPVPGHDVQIVRYNGDDSGVVVKVDQDLAQMPLSRADQFIRNRI
jgi:hypothetical protein